MYTAFARNAVMGANPAWTRRLFGVALVPDLVLYLEIDVEHLVSRVLAGGGMNDWETGLHRASGAAIFESVGRHQRASPTHTTPSRTRSASFGSTLGAPWMR